ncbi:MAG TPA: radical SAM protein [Rectinemataceae bacterium]|nr:radical SAM protein [Rectinemataceae bacterium]
METIVRKSLLNRSALGFLCINHVQGCSHGCLYPCYAFSMARSYGRVKSYEEWTAPRLVGNAEELLGRELARLRTRPDRVHLSLTTDPFMYRQAEVGTLSLNLIAAINARGIPVSVLSKGILPAELAGRDRFPEDNVYGISIVSLSEEFRQRWEPGAAPYTERIAALRALHDEGRRTRAHIEPYPTPNLCAQDLAELLESVAFVDSIYFGGWNYSAAAKVFPDREGFYRETLAGVRRFCEERGIGFEGRQ